MKVLIVDDNIKMRTFLRKLLDISLRDSQILDCENGEEAVSLYKSENPELILMDIMMDRMDGLTAVRLIRGLSNKPKVIVISQLPEAEFRSEAILSGANEYLNKDNLTELPKIINKILN